MPKFISDTEMTELEAKELPKGFISDEEMSKMEQSGSSGRKAYFDELKKAASTDILTEPKPRQLMNETSEENYINNLIEKARGGDAQAASGLLGRQREAKNKLDVVESLPAVTGAVPFGGGVGEYARQKIMGEDTDIGNIAIETALSGIPYALPLAKKAVMGGAGLVGKGLSAIRKAPVKGSMSSVTTPSDILDVLKEEQAAFKLTPEMEAQNALYKKQGLEPLTAAQQQTKAFNEPTRAQITETMLRSRDPELIAQQTKQAESLKRLEDDFRAMGHPNPEVASQQIMEKIYGKGGLKETAGKKIGEYMQPIENESVFGKKKMPDLTDISGKLLKEDKGIIKEFADEFKKAKTYRDLSNLNSKIAQMSAKKELGSAGEKALNEIKAASKSAFIDKMKQMGITNPEEAYEQYAMATGMVNRGGVLAGVEALGHEKDLINKVTRSGSTVKEFRDTVTKLGDPELMTTIKENWLKELFSKPNWVSEWKKFKSKSDIVNELLPKEQIQKIDIMSQYKTQAESTASKVVNPSRSGLLGLATRTMERPVTSMISYILGDEVKYARAMSQYKKLSGLAKEEGKLITPGRLKTGAIMQGTRIGNKIKNEED